VSLHVVTTSAAGMTAAYGCGSLDWARSAAAILRTHDTAVRIARTRTVVQGIIPHRLDGVPRTQAEADAVRQALVDVGDVALTVRIHFLGPEVR